MEKVKIQRIPSTIGDITVSGIASGLLGGLAMALVISLFSLLGGQGFSYLGDFATGSPVLPLQGVLMHLAVSCIYGMLFALAYHWTGLDRLHRLPGWLAGLVYALILWGFAMFVLLPAAHSLMLQVPWIVFFTGHIVYGLVLGFRQKP